MNIWALRRLMFVRRYGMWLSMFCLLALPVAYAWQPDHPYWAAADAWLTKLTGTFLTAASRNLAVDTSAHASPNTRTGLFGFTSGRPRTIAGYAESEIRCLALAVYHDGAGETLQTKRAIAQVAMNRARARKDAKSLCKVVYFGVGLPHGCMFSAACRQIGAVTPEPGPGWTQAMEVATEAVTTPELVPKLLEATHFHPIDSVRPDWTRQLYRVAIVGHYIFYSAVSTEDAAEQPATAQEPAVTAATPAKPNRPRVSPPSERPVAGSSLSSVFERN